MYVTGWSMRAIGQPMVEEARDEEPRAGEVVVAVAGCGICHTDLGFWHEGVPTRHALPLTLGHEISGRVVAVGAGAELWKGKIVVVPAVIPCGVCPACKSGRGSICTKQIFPGNDVHGGFATHVRVPAHGLCEVPDLGSRANNPHGLELWMLSVIADAVSTPYQAILRSDLKPDDLAVFVGAGGVGGFGVQIAAALGARVVAIDVDPERLALAGEHGATLTLRADQLEHKELRKRVRELGAKSGTPTWRHKIFETSGTPQGQATAFGLLEPGAFLSVVGYTPQKVELRLSNLMAFDATAQGNWGCLPEHYPAVLALVLGGKVALRPFVERRELAAINAAFSDVQARKTKRRIVLTPSS